MSSAVWMLDENDSCSVRSTGFTLSHLLPRMSTTTVKPRARTSSLTDRQAGGQTGHEFTQPKRPEVPLLGGLCAATIRGRYLGMVDRYVTSRLRSSCFIRSWLVLAGKVRIGPPRLSRPPVEHGCLNWVTLGANWDRELGENVQQRVCFFFFLPDTKATFSLSTVRTSTARTHSALPEPERRMEIF